jgi:hypothetical protein
MGRILAQVEYTDGTEEKPDGTDFFGFQGHPALSVPSVYSQLTNP